MEIKIRIYDDDRDTENKFHYFDLGIDGNGGRHGLFRSKLALMRGEMNLFSGQEDKSGVQIFEGDILHDDSSTYGLQIVKFGIVDIEDNECYGSNDVCGFYLEHYKTGHTRHFEYLNSKKVIGNIYQDSELLEKK